MKKVQKAKIAKMNKKILTSQNIFEPTHET